MRWVVVSDDLLPCPGGVAVWTDSVVEGLRHAGHEVRVFGRWREGLAADVVGVRQRSFARWGYLGLTAAARHDVERADAVLATTWHVAPLQHTGWVVCHGSDLTTPAPRPRRRRRVLRRCRVGAVSAFLARRADALGARSTVLASPVDAAPRPRRLPPRASAWLWAGRMVPGKGGDRFVRLVAAAGVRGTMLGDGPLRARWEALARRCGADVTFAGWRPPGEVRDALGSHDLLLCLPRTPEGLGLVALEAAARGVPVVGCDVGGLAEAVGPGILLEAPDDASSSVDAIRATWSPRLGEACWEHVRAHHGVAKLVAQLEAGAL